MFFVKKNKSLSEPVLLKKDTNTAKKIETLSQLLADTDSSEKKKIEQELCFAKSGWYGEKKVLYELENSHMPMYILHDVYLQRQSSQRTETAQIDFIVITRKLIFIIECKNRACDIHIDKMGNFNVKYANDALQQGIYNPLEQNRKHIEVVHALLKETNPKHFDNKKFYKICKSVLTFSHEQTVFHISSAPQDMKKTITKTDNLIRYMQKLSQKTHVPEMSDEEMKALADFFVKQNIRKRPDYTAKYHHLISISEQKKQKPSKTQSVRTVKINCCPKCKKEVKFGQYGYYCTGKCGMMLNKANGKALTKEQIQKLLNGQKVNCGDFTILPEVFVGNTKSFWKIG